MTETATTDNAKAQRDEKLQRVLQASTNLEQLINELCPDGVPFVEIGSVLKPSFGQRITKTANQGTRYPVYGGGGESFRTDEFNRQDDFVISRFALSEECVRFVKGRFWLLDSGFTIDVVQPVVNKRFVYHFLLRIQPNIYRCASGAAQRNLRTNEFLQFKIPLPPVEVQEEIVRILDLFTELEAELEAELEKRRAQYSYYRDQLLSFNTLTEIGRESLGEILWLPLVEVATLSYGLTASAEKEGPYRFVRITDIDEYGVIRNDSRVFVQDCHRIEEYVLEPGDLLMARTGATYGKTALVKKTEDEVYASFLIRIRTDRSRLMPEYYWHFAQSSHYWKQAQKYVSGAAQPQFNGNKLGRISVPIPSISEQQRVAQVLDAMDVLVNDLVSGLPAELEARRKQYAYYRDRLLSFKERPSSSTD